MFIFHILGYTGPLDFCISFSFIIGILSIDFIAHFFLFFLVFLILNLTPVFISCSIHISLRYSSIFVPLVSSWVAYCIYIYVYYGYWVNYCSSSMYYFIWMRKILFKVSLKIFYAIVHQLYLHHFLLFLFFRGALSFISVLFPLASSLIIICFLSSILILFSFWGWLFSNLWYSFSMAGIFLYNHCFIVLMY